MLIYDRRSVGQPVSVSGSHLEPMTRFLFPVWRLWVSWYGAPSLRRGWVCNLFVQLLLGLARAATLGSKSHGPHDHNLLFHLRLLQLSPVTSSQLLFPLLSRGGPNINRSFFPTVAFMRCYRNTFNKSLRLLVTMELNATSNWIATDNCRTSLMREVPTNCWIQNILLN
jgi:hypothetical protein